MHASRHASALIILSACVITTGGCRGGRPLAGLVKVSSQPNAEVAEIQSPPQRLASAKTVAVEQSDSPLMGPSTTPRRGSLRASESPGPAAQTVAQTSSLDPDVPPATGPQPTARPASETATAAAPTPSASSAPATMSLTDREPLAAQSERLAGTADRPAAATPRSSSDTAIGRQNTRRTERLLTEESVSRKSKRSGAEPAAAAVDQPDHDATAVVVADDSVPPDAAAMMDAFRNSPPEIQQQAIRQLVAIAARGAEKTSQPASIDDLLQQAMMQPIDLPQPSPNPPAKPTTRIASTTAVAAASRARMPETRQDAEVRSLSDQLMAGVASPPVQGRSRDVTEVAADDLIGSDDAANDLPVAEIGLPRVDHRAATVQTAALRSDAAEPGAAASDVEQVAVHGQPLSPPPEPILSNSQASPAADPAAAGLSELALFELLIKRLQQPVTDESEAQRSRREIMIRHLMVMSGKPDAAVNEMAGLTTEEQEYLRHQLMGLWTIIDPQGHPVPSRRFSSALPQIREATKHLAASTDSLEIRSLAFCTNIESFGQIKEFPSRRFKPGQQVILYCEVDNFNAKKIDGGFETHLQGSYTVYDQANQKVVSQLLPADLQVSRSYLRDYFIAYQMPIPEQLEKGSYRLELTMEDLHGKKYGQANLDFDVKP